MRAVSFSFLAILLFLSPGESVHAQTSPTAFTENLSVGSSGPQVLVLQKLLNQDPTTRIASTGSGSPGNESAYFGALTKAAVVRFQQKYAKQILTPAGLTQGNGRVGTYTRAMLNAVRIVKTNTVVGSVTTSTTPSAPITSNSYVVASNEQIDIYAGDALLKKIRDAITSKLDASIDSRGATPPAFDSVAELPYPSVGIKSISGQSGIPGTKITLSGIGIDASSKVFLGSGYAVRLSQDTVGNWLFAVPAIPSGLYDMALQTGDNVSGTLPFVVIDTKNPAVHIDSVSPQTISYDGELTIVGSGFTAQHNMVYMRYQEKVDVPSSDGKTLVVHVTPESLKSSAKVGNGAHPIPITVSIVNDNGFSDTTKSFTLSL